jgi:predicted metal-dependent hydrolase
MKIIRSKRKTLALVIDKDGSLIVRAPLNAARREIDVVVEKHRDWIEKKQAEMKRRVAESKRAGHAVGQEFWFLGKPYPVSLSEKTTPPLKLQTNRFVLSKGYVHHAQAVFENWYRSQAHLLLSMRVQQLASEHHLTYASIRITSARTRWGSCSAKGGLNFSWRLIMAPIEVIDYVIIHELAHLIHRNHSKAFWVEVERMLPDYKQHRKWLKDNGHRMGFERVEIAD